MSVFGDLDMDKVPDDPFFIPADSYWAVLTETKFVDKGEDGCSLSFTWTVDDVESDYHGRAFKDYFNLPAGWPSVDYDSLDGKEKMSVSRLKQRLRKGCDLSESELAELDDWADLVGSEAFLRTGNSESSDGRKFNNILEATSRREWDENNADKDESTDVFSGV